MCATEHRLDNIFQYWEVSVSAMQGLCMSRNMEIRIFPIFWGYLKCDKNDIFLEHEAPDSLIWTFLWGSLIYVPQALTENDPYAWDLR